MVPSWFERRLALILNLALLAIGTIFVGPFMIETNLIVMCVALGITGFLIAPLMILPLQEMINSTKLAYPEYD